jgi:uncharacterized protein involved in type VI secretion and phage assembly
MIERADTQSEHRLMTWRCARSPSDPAWDGAGERIADHRVRYLDYEGELGSGRGSVERVESGTVLTLEHQDDRLDLSIEWTDRVVRYRGGRVEQDRWMFGIS